MSPQLQSALNHLLALGLFPAWMLAGLFDYLCHRKTRIELTSGTTESWYHIAQFLSLGIALSVITLFVFSTWVMTVVTVLVVMHTMLAFADTWYTETHRYISPFEQMVHDVMNVIPIAAVYILAVMNWHVIQNDAGQWQLTQITWRAALMLGVFWLATGALIIEEWYRTKRVRRKSALR